MARTYVPAEQDTRRWRPAVPGRCRPSRSSSSRLIVTRRAPQLRLLAVARQLVRLAAGDAHGRVVGRDLLDLAAEPAEACSTSAAVGRGASVGVSSPSRSSVVRARAEARPWRDIPCRRPRWYSTRRVAWPTKTGRTPAANGIERAAVADALDAGQPADQRHDVVRVGPGSLATTRMPSSDCSVTLRRSIASAGGRIEHAAGIGLVDRAVDASRLTRGHGRRHRTCRSARSRPGRPSRVRTLILRPASRLAGTGSRARPSPTLAEQVAQALGVLDGRAGRLVVGFEQRRPDQAAVEVVARAAPARGRTASAARSAWCDRAAVPCPTAARRRRPAPRPRAASAASRWDAGSWPCR